MTLELTAALKINPILKPAHLQFYHSVSPRGATRLMTYYRDVLGKKKLTFFDFYKIAGAFPSPTFKPHWTMIEAPITANNSQKVHKAAKAI